MNLKTNEVLKNVQLPYEKCLENGAHTLSDAELLAVILRCGTKERNVLELAGELIDRICVNSKLASFCNTAIEELMNISGIGKVKAVMLSCVFELSKRIASEPISSNMSFTSPDQVALCFMAKMRLLETEHVYLLLLDSKNCLLKQMVLSSGSVGASILEPREVFIHALRHNAVGIILLHNHPSGNPTPSRDDIVTTVKIKDAGRLIGIQLIDHIIIGDNCYVSMKQDDYID